MNKIERFDKQKHTENGCQTGPKYPISGAFLAPANHCSAKICQYSVNKYHFKTPICNFHQNRQNMNFNVYK